jgi:citrate lyase subunit beta / citryl-CoA lyase
MPALCFDPEVAVRLRSLLFVPADRPDRFAKALASGADVLIFDLEDSVIASRKEEARRIVASFIVAAGERSPKLFVRINSLDSGLTDSDLAAAANADGIVLPKSDGPVALANLDRLLGAAPTLILPIATETPAAIFTLGCYGGVTKRLCGMTWGAEDLPAAIGALTSREPDGSFTMPYQIARALMLFGAHAAGVPAIDTVFPDFRDLQGLSAYAQKAMRDGFSGMLAIHPAQIDVINHAFTPSAAAIAQARQIVAAFETRPEAGALQFEGRMIDAPHLKQARRILALAGDPD